MLIKTDDKIAVRAVRDALQTYFIYILTRSFTIVPILYHNGT